MRRNDWLQRILYLCMLLFGVYILYKGSLLLIRGDGSWKTGQAGTVQQAAGDAAMRTWAPGYTAVVENRESSSLLSSWMRQIVPVYSYLADLQAAEEESGTGSAQAGGAAGQAGEESGADSAAAGEPAVQTTEAAETGEAAGHAGEESGAGSEETGEAAGQAGEESGTGSAEEGETSAQAAEEESGTGSAEAGGPAAEASAQAILADVLPQLDFSSLLTYYTVDPGTTADDTLLDAQRLLTEDLTLDKNPQVPQILVYHTHSQEAFADSAEGVTEETIVGMGEVLAGELRSYGYQVIHDTGVYDLVDGVLDRSAAYDYAREAVEEILRQNPTIEVIIDLHRDGVEGDKPVTEIDGKPVSRIMFFNGISRNAQGELLYWLENPYLTQNLAFSLQLEVLARSLYPGFTRNIYLKAERYNLHLRPRSLLIEAGSQLNTVEEERNAMKPLARLLHLVLSGSSAVSQQM